MLRFFVRLLAAIGFLTVLTLCAVGYVGYLMVFERPSLPDRMVLHIDLNKPLVDHISDDPVAGALLPTDVSLRDIVVAIDRAGQDDRVGGVLVRFGAEALSFTQAQELRLAVQRFRNQDRFTYAFADSFGELNPANATYYLASAFDQVWMQPIGMLGLTGFSAEMPFARGLLDRLAIDPEIESRHEYKTALEFLTETSISEPHRRMTDDLLEALGNQLIAGVAAGRSLDPLVLRGLIDRGPLLDREAVEAGLVDRLGYFDEVTTAVETEAGAEVEVVPLERYLAATEAVLETDQVLAVIHAQGSIQRGPGGGDPLLGGTFVASQTVADAFRDAAEDESVRAIVFRIDSPGGSAVASETIRRAVMQARDAGKPVVVTMGDNAASGGYWIAMEADHIIAHRGTLTGSIGVLGGKVATERLWSNLGVRWDHIDGGRNAGMWSSVRPYSTDGRNRLSAALDAIYAAFTNRVGAARALDAGRLDAVARGRVWTGAQALDLGLVDELGDFHLATRRAAERAGLDPDTPVSLQAFPRPRSTFDRLLSLLMAGTRPAPTLTVLQTLDRYLPTVVRLLRGLALTPGERLVRASETVLPPHRQ